MRQMVTRGFYDRSYIGLWMFEVIGREYDGMAEWARTLRNELFPQTCTCSIAIWEFVYGYEPDDRLSLEFRRARLLSARASNPPINPARIEAALSIITGCPVKITENYGPYKFLVQVDESNSVFYEYRNAVRLLREMKPSHLSFWYESRKGEEFTRADYTAGAISDHILEYLLEEFELAAETTDYSAGAQGELIMEVFME